MAYTKPTAADLQERFPGFAAVPASAVNTALAEAEAYVSSTWPNETQYRLGLMLHAAHTMTLDGLGTSAEAQLARDGALDVESITTGRLSIKKAARQDDQAGHYHKTQFGMRFLELQRRNTNRVLAADSDALMPNVSEIEQ